MYLLHKHFLYLHILLLRRDLCLLLINLLSDYLLRIYVYNLSSIFASAEGLHCSTADLEAYD